MVELLLDSAIRFWVFMPIVVITFFVGMLRHYISIITAGEKPIDKQQLADSQALIRTRILRENGKYIPKEGFVMRKHFFVNEENGYLTKQQGRQQPIRNPITGNNKNHKIINKINILDPTMMTEMLKNNISNMVPMIVIGGVINWAFSGFLCTKVPFPLTYRFKPMLQRGVELATLDASWLSSVSWYAINIFGQRGINNLLLGENNAADQTKMMQDQMNMAAVSMPQDSSKAFKAEREGLLVVDHQWAFRNVENDVISQRSYFRSR
ncbi:unnamed protein product [Rotaria sp. Silwood1]|nr:unnamed protein product [Rotaria sp. Silwood1]CAF3506902.1 unnamed protein product [Rotaria sp. Silwood1]CAF3572447.1 unnamed protein product [Rotaria sp. Silwood1]CAF4585412.1 unnamed protein product [Rotaria sp. Silwood1]CAF4602373.1 unnamed protein product [Rotaria sp. Silwood1]